MNPISLAIILASFVIAGAFWAQHQNERGGVHRKGVPLKRFSNEVAQLKRRGEPSKLIQRLVELVDASEDQHARIGGGVCPWYYEQLAHTYHEAERYVDELQILQRYATQAHPKHPSSTRVLDQLQSARSAAVQRGRQRIEQELLLRAAQR